MAGRRITLVEDVVTTRSVLTRSDLYAAREDARP